MLALSREMKNLVLKSIIDSVFIRDIRAFIKEDKIIDLRKIFGFIGTNIGSPFSLEGLSSFVDEKMTHTKMFLDILQKNFLIFRITSFTSNKRNELKGKFKLYLSDFGMMNYFLGKNEVSDFTGEYIEMFVFLQLQYNLSLKNELYFWQNLNKKEIDFILKTGDMITPIEVKSTNNDVIPKIFYSFDENYGKKIDHFIRTTLSVNKNRDIE